MEYLSLESVSKSYGEKVLFDQINLAISRGNKIALIARNGSGKSTLLRVIAGHEQPEGENARINLNKHIRLGFLDQEPHFEDYLSVEEVIYNTDLPNLKALKAYKDALDSNNAAAIERATALMEDLKAWDADAKAKEVLFRLNLKDPAQQVGALSGGQKKRLALARIILSEPDFLILDEPTNHLDIEMIEWLERYLSSPNLTIFMVTHDRYFLERVCNEIIELDKGKLFVYKGNYSDYLEKKALRSHVDNTALDKSKKLLTKELAWIRRQPKARGTKAKSRVDGFHKLQDEISGITYDEVFEIEVDSARLGKKIVEFHDVHKAYDDLVILKEFWYKFKKGERVGISGPNGTGKTTFVKILVGAIEPDKGRRIQGETVQFGYYTQDGLVIDQDKRVIDVIKDIGEYIPLKKGYKLSAAALLENFMFTREQQQVYVSQLSGGERKRLHLLTVLMANPNFLILDEPTNDLDVLTLNVLEDYLMKFKGCLVIISHDRYFMDKLIDHLFVFSGDGRIDDFNGTYSEWKSQQSPSSTTHKKLQKSHSEPTDIEDEPRKLSYLEKKELKTIETKLAQSEKRIKEIEQSFEEGIEDQQKITALSKELGALRSEIDTMEMRWLELSEFL